MMNPPNSFWHAMSACMSALTLMICIAMYRSDQIEVERSGWKMKLMAVKAEAIVEKMETAMPPALPPMPDVGDDVPPPMPVPPPKVEQLKRDLEEFKRDANEMNVQQRMAK